MSDGAFIILALGALDALASLLRCASYPAAMVREINVDEIGSGALALLHVLWKDVTTAGAPAGPYGAPAPGAEAPARLDARARALVCVCAGANVLAAYVFLGRADADEYNPQLHGAQALLLVLDALVYVGARRRA